MLYSVTANCAKMISFLKIISNIKWKSVNICDVLVSQNLLFTEATLKKQEAKMSERSPEFHCTYTNLSSSLLHAFN